MFGRKSKEEPKMKEPVYEMIKVKCFCGHPFYTKTVIEGTSKRIIEPVICPKCGRSL